MKTFLNGEERKDMIMLFSIVGVLQEKFLGGWDKRGNLTSDERKYLKSTVTFAFKVAKSIMGRIDGNLAERLTRDINSTDIFCLPKSEAKLKKETFEKEEVGHYIGVTREAIDILAQRALYWCDPCNVEDCSKCNLKKIFRDLDVEPFDYNAKDCEYRINKGGE